MVVWRVPGVGPGRGVNRLRPIGSAHAMKPIHHRNKSGHDALRDELRSLIADAERMVNEEVVTPSADALNALRERLESARDQLGELYDTAKERVVNGAHSTDEAIRERPYETAAVSAVIGLLVGLLIGRSRD